METYKVGLMYDQYTGILDNNYMRPFASLQWDASLCSEWPKGSGWQRMLS